MSKETDWPPLTFEQRPWTTEPAPGVSRRQRLLARGPYEAAVPPAISDLDPGVDSATQSLVETATMEMVRFDAELGQDSTPFAALLLRSESASSSQIENLTAGARKIVLAQLGDRSSINASLVASNVEAMQAAIALSEDLSVDNIGAMHHTLLSASDRVIAGEYRTSQVWIRGNSPHSAEFVPPHHDLVPGGMTDLVEFMETGRYSRADPGGGGPRPVRDHPSIRRRQWAYRQGHCQRTAACQRRHRECHDPGVVRPPD